MEPIPMEFPTPEIEMRGQEEAPPPLCTADQSFILLKNPASGVYVHVNASNGRLYPLSGPVGSIAPRAFRIVPTPQEEGQKGVMLKSVATGKYVRPLGRGEEGVGSYVAEGMGGALTVFVLLYALQCIMYVYVYHIDR